MRQSGKVIVAVGVFVFMVVLSLSIGDVDDLFCKLLRIGEKRFSHTDLIILFELRVPRVLMAIGVGAMLSMSGVIMQSLFRNPLVEPYTMGLSGGAVLGVAMAFVFGLSNSMGNIAVTLMAMVGALSTMGLILLLRKMMHFDINRMLLSGVMISFATSSVTTLLMSLTTRENLSQILMWNMGSLDITTKEVSYCVLLMAILMAIVLPFAGRMMNVLMISEDMARHVGVKVKVVVPLLFVVATIMAAVSVSFVGVIAFVGMIVPHIVKVLYGNDHRLVVVMSALCGGTFLLMCDIVSRTIIYPQEIPTGVMCGIVGGVMFVYLMTKNK